MGSVDPMGRRFRWKKRKKLAEYQLLCLLVRRGVKWVYPVMSFLCWGMESSDMSRLNPSSPIRCPQQVVPIKYFGHSNEKGASYFLSKVWAEDNRPTSLASIQAMDSKTASSSHLSISRTHSLVSVSAFMGAVLLDQGVMCWKLVPYIAMLRDGEVFKR